MDKGSIKSDGFFLPNSNINWTYNNCTVMITALKLRNQEIF